VLIYGLWMTARSWDRWAQHYRAKGHEVIGPSYPGFEIKVEALREARDHRPGDCPGDARPFQRRGRGRVCALFGHAAFSPSPMSQPSHGTATSFQPESCQGFEADLPRSSNRSRRGAAAPSWERAATPARSHVDAESRV